MESDRDIDMTKHRRQTNTDTDTDIDTDQDIDTETHWVPGGTRILKRRYWLALQCIARLTAKQGKGNKKDEHKEKAGGRKYEDATY